jgi:hypothetical protein
MADVWNKVGKWQDLSPFRDIVILYNGSFKAEMSFDVHFLHFSFWLLTYFIPLPASSHIPNSGNRFVSYIQPYDSGFVNLLKDAIFWQKSKYFYSFKHP